MMVPSLFTEPGRVDQPQSLGGYADVLTRVAAEGKPVIICRNGADLAAVIPLEHLELVREILAREEVEKLANQIDWERVPQTRRPPQAWFEEIENPFEPQEGFAP
jgi:prevent-host-death family protein